MWESNTKVTVKERDHEQALKGSCESLLPGKRRTRASLAPTADTLAGCQSGTRSYPQSHPRPLRDMQVTHEVTLTNFPCVLQSHCKSGSPRATASAHWRGEDPKWELPTQTLCPMHLCVPSALAIMETQKRGIDRGHGAGETKMTPGQTGARGVVPNTAPLPEGRKPRNNGRCRNHERTH